MINRYTVRIDGRDRAVEIEDVDGGLRVIVDGRERSIDARRLAEGGWSLLEGVSARLVQVGGEPGKGKMTVEVSHPDGEPRLCTAEVSDARAAAAAPGAGTAPGAGPTTLRAPIPGKVVKVLVKAGEVVQAGQALLVLEAMKMENELRAPRAGVVSMLHATEGSAVETGQDLISLG